MIGFRKAVAVTLIGMAGMGMASQAQANDGRDAALIGGAALGVIAGAAIANAASANEAQPVGWDGYNDGPTYYAPPRPHHYAPAYPTCLRQLCRRGASPGLVRR